MIWMAGILLLQVAADPTHVDQLPDTRGIDPVIRVPHDPAKPATVTVTQVPKGLEPKSTASETRLIPPTPVTAASRAEIEIARAAGLIRDRGQQVTPELLAREVGPDILDVYLAQTSGLPPTGIPDPTNPTSPTPGGPK